MNPPWLTEVRSLREKINFGIGKKSANKISEMKDAHNSHPFAEAVAFITRPTILERGCSSRKNSGIGQTAKTSAFTLSTSNFQFPKCDGISEDFLKIGEAEKKCRNIPRRPDKSIIPATGWLLNTRTNSFFHLKRYFERKTEWMFEVMIHGLVFIGNRLVPYVFFVHKLIFVFSCVKCPSLSWNRRNQF